MNTPPPPERGSAPGGTGRRRSRRRRGRGRGERPAQGRPAPVVPEVSHIAATAAGGDTLAPAEIAEMKEHLVFLRRYKDILRLKLNAAEDLLVNGQREPSERGVCHHLLGKIDRAVIEAAVAREPLRSDAAARARMLAGAIRLTADLGVLLAYLETLAHVRSRTEAAQAFSEVVRRIDFESLSPTRLARLLQVLIETFVDHERVQVLFSLLAAPSFRRAFDGAAGAFPPQVADACAPLRAVHARLVQDADPSADATRWPGWSRCSPLPIGHSDLYRRPAHPMLSWLRPTSLPARRPRRGRSAADSGTGGRTYRASPSARPRSSSSATRRPARGRLQDLRRHSRSCASRAWLPPRRAAARAGGAEAASGAAGSHRALADGQRTVWVRTAAPEADGWPPRRSCGGARRPRRRLHDRARGPASVRGGALRNVRLSRPDPADRAPRSRSPPPRRACCTPRAGRRAVLPEPERSSTPHPRRSCSAISTACAQWSR
jgi:hypothetical protein